MEEHILFADRENFRRWLIKNHATHKGFWIVLGKGKKLKNIKPDEALEEALCFGWIDGLIKSIDDTKYIKKFSPRRKGSNWSTRNREIATQLIKSGKMAEHGIKTIEEAKRTGAWDKPKREPVLDSQVEILVKAINGAEPAFSNFLKMPPSVRKTYTAFYLDAKKEEARINRLKKIIERLNENKKPM
jgi:uncharacterized protein YdeI (YjbR/CyaY-like superfamily)